MNPPTPENTSSAKQFPEATPKQWPQTDNGNAELFAELYAENVRFDHKRGRWLIWDKEQHRWLEDTQDGVRILAKNAARHRAKCAASIANKDEASKEFRWAMESENSHRINSTLREAKALSSIADDGEGWDAEPWLFGVANGVIDLRTGELREETQEDRITKFSPVKFDAKASCRRFIQFLSEIFDGDSELIAYVQKMCGYSLTGSVREQCLFALYGSGANGKTTFLECILFIMGEYGTDLPFSALEPQRFGCSPGEGVDLPGARLAKSVEIREGRHLDEARIKSWTGGDTITVRPLYKNQFSFRPTHKLWLCFNHRPLISDDTNAMWRRMRLIPFGQTFGPDKIDKNLPNVLQAEASGVLNWMLAGCLSWQKEGLEPPTVVQTATTKYAADSDVLQPFFDERCEIGDRFEVPKGELWTAYQQYAAASRERALDRKVFSERLSNRFGERRTKTVRYWTGIGLRREAVMPVAVGRPLTIDLTGMAADGEDHHTLRLSLEPGEDGDG